MPQQFYCESKTQPPTGWRYATFQTELGWITAIWHSQGLAGMTFGLPDSVAAARWANEFLARHQRQAEWADEAKIPWRLTRRLRAFADGKAQNFADVPLDVTHLAPFGRKVAAQCCSLEWGETASYAEIAARAGSPAAARAVGNCMKTNRIPLLIPCHRVVGAGGSLGGYSAPSGLDMKRRLLAAEGMESAVLAAK